MAFWVSLLTTKHDYWFGKMRIIHHYWFGKMRFQHTTFIAMTITVLGFALN
jgi:hypothetical protein